MKLKSYAEVMSVTRLRGPITAASASDSESECMNASGADTVCAVPGLGGTHISTALEDAVPRERANVTHALELVLVWGLVISQVRTLERLFRHALHCPWAINPICSCARGHQSAPA